MTVSLSEPLPPTDILVVEDSPIQALLIRRALTGQGMSVLVASGGAEGLALAQRHHPRIILSDVAMPGMDGFALCRAIKQDPLLRGCIVVLLTMLSDPQEIVMGVEAGADHYLIKPRDEQQLIAELERFLAQNAEERCRETVNGLEVRYAEESRLVQADRRQIMNLLLSTYETLFRQNQALRQTQEALEQLRQRQVGEAQQQQDHLLKELENSNRELKEFAYIVSHDLKAPLRAIDALVQWIAEDYAAQFDEDGREQMQLLTKRVARMQSLIDGVLQYSRIGRLREEMTPVNLGRLLHQVVEFLAPPPHIEIKIMGRMPILRCEKVRMQQVFQNLFSNGIKFMDKPRGEIRVECLPREEFWQFSVADNGPGIERKNFDKIFQIFQTLQSRDQYESTGIGLTLVKKIVELYGGTIWLESEPGKGTTFFFTLPRDSEPLSSSTTAPSEE